MNWQYTDETRKVVCRTLADGTTESGFAEVLAPGQDLEVMVSPLEQRIARLLAAVDAHLNAPAVAKGYDSIKSAALRAGYPGPFHDEGVAFATWMDACFARCYQLLAQFNAGDIAEPTEEELIALLPVLELP